MNKFLNRGLLLAGLAATVTMAGAASASAGLTHDKSRDWSPCAESSHREGGKRGLTAIGLTIDQKLVKFDVRKPGKAFEVGEVATSTGTSTSSASTTRCRTTKPYGVGDLPALVHCWRRRRVRGRVTLIFSPTRDQTGAAGGIVVKVGDVVYVGRSASVQFGGASAFVFRVIRVDDRPAY